MEDPIRGDLARAELDRMGLRHFLDVRATARRILDRMPLVQRTAFAAATAERLWREEEQLPEREQGPDLTIWGAALDAVWRVLAGDAAAGREVAAAVARFYLNGGYLDRRHDDPADAVDHVVMASCYTAECSLHGCLEFAVWTGWRGFDWAARQAAADLAWPPRRPAGVSPYAWELAHPAVQAELDSQLADLEVLSVDGDVLHGRMADRGPLLERLRAGTPGLDPAAFHPPGNGYAQQGREDRGGD